MPPKKTAPALNETTPAPAEPEVPKAVADVVALLGYALVPDVITSKELRIRIREVLAAFKKHVGVK